MKKNKIGKLKIAEGDLLTDLLDLDAIREELALCLIQGDAESFKEILSAFVEACDNKNKLSKKSSLSRDTIYRILRKENISVDSVFKILNAG